MEKSIYLRIPEKLKNQLFILQKKEGFKSLSEFLRFHLTKLVDDADK